MSLHEFFHLMPLGPMFMGLGLWAWIAHRHGRRDDAKLPLVYLGFGVMIGLLTFLGGKALPSSLNPDCAVRTHLDCD